MIIKVGLIVASYLLGSISWGIIFGRLLKKIDIREVDLPGAAGSFRQLGVLPGIMVGVLDILKAAVPILIAITTLKMAPTTMVPILCALAATAGHNWPIFFRFRGGMGISTTMGALICLMPKALSVALPSAILAGFIFRRIPPIRRLLPPIPAGALMGFILLPFLAWFFYRHPFLIVFTLLLFLLALIRQIPDLRRMFGPGR